MDRPYVHAGGPIVRALLSAAFVRDDDNGVPCSGIAQVQGITTRPVAPTALGPHRAAPEEALLRALLVCTHQRFGRSSCTLMRRLASSCVRIEVELDALAALLRRWENRARFAVPPGSSRSWTQPGDLPCSTAYGGRASRPRRWTGSALDP